MGILLLVNVGVCVVLIIPFFVILDYTQYLLRRLDPKSKDNGNNEFDNN